jgi:hypothetical protein
VKVGEAVNLKVDECKRPARVSNRCDRWSETALWTARFIGSTVTAHFATKWFDAIIAVVEIPAALHFSSRRRRPSLRG